MNFYSLILEINHRTALKISDSDNDIKEGFKSVWTVVLLFDPLDTNNFRTLHDEWKGDQA